MFVKVCPELGYKTVKRLRRFLCGSSVVLKVLAGGSITDALGYACGFALRSVSVVRCDYVLEEGVFGKGKLHQLAPCPDSFSGLFQGTGLGDVFSLFRIVAKNRAQSLGTIENRFFHSFWGNCPPVCHSSSIREPSVITSPPMMVLALAGSPRKRMDRKMVMATLSLSMGATLETSPNCRALK